MKVAVMQPYIFPYIGYFQLLNAVDHFVFYDDVNYIKGGWINRNKILVSGEASLFTIPLEKASSFSEIKAINIHPILYQKWLKKFIQTLNQSYKKAPFFNDVFPIIKNILEPSKINSIGNLSIKSIIEISNYLQLEKKFHISSEKFSDRKGKDKTERLLYILNDLECEEYINPIGGEKLYSRDDFKAENIKLNFIKGSINRYPQISKEFIPGLSILDVLMFNSIEDIKIMLNDYELL